MANDTIQASRDWLAKADYVLIPALILCLALIGFSLYRRRPRQG